MTPISCACAVIAYWWDLTDAATPRTPIADFIAVVGPGDTRRWRLDIYDDADILHKDPATRYLIHWMLPKHIEAVMQAWEPADTPAEEAVRLLRRALDGPVNIHVAAVSVTLEEPKQ